MNLTGEQFADLQKALLSAFPSRQRLEQMLRIKLDEHLLQVAGGDNLSDIVFNLIIWAESKGKTLELITKAHEHNSGNPLLDALASKFSHLELEPRPPTSKMSLRTMRSQLNQLFDDVELDTLCMLNFSRVYDKFSRGMRKDEKINLLLDYCRRTPERKQQLQAILEASS